MKNIHIAYAVLFCYSLPLVSLSPDYFILKNPTDRDVTVYMSKKFWWRKKGQQLKKFTLKPQESEKVYYPKRGATYILEFEYNPVYKAELNDGSTFTYDILNKKIEVHPSFIGQQVSIPNPRPDFEAARKAHWEGIQRYEQIVVPAYEAHERQEQEELRESEGAAVELAEPEVH